MSATTTTSTWKSAGATKAEVDAHIRQRRAARKPLSVPVDLTVLRSGIPYSMPGRSVNLSEVGAGVVVAGELPKGDAVGLELRLPNSRDPLYIKAVVRYQGPMCCGLEFVGLSEQQLAAIRDWTAQTFRSSDNELAVARYEFSKAQWAEIVGPKRRRRILVPTLWAALVVFLIVGGLGWWRWYRAWNDLEAGIPATSVRPGHPPTKVPSDVMARFITHKVEPVYPEGARVEGVVLLDTVIGTDGSVVEVHSVSGPNDLASAAVDAVKWWRFEPYRINGQPVAVETTLAVDFKQN